MNMLLIKSDWVVISLFKIILLIGLLFNISFVFAVDELPKNLITSEEYQIGLMVKKITASIHEPENPASLKTIVLYGTDTRYYVMIRGWLTQELSGVKSQNLANYSNGIENSKLIQKESFLTKAIRQIDLE